MLMDRSSSGAWDFGLGSIEEQTGIAVTAALARLLGLVDQYTELIRSAGADSGRTGERPPELQRLGKDLGSKERQKAEQAARRAAEAINRQFEQILDEMIAEAPADTEGIYLPSVEQMVAVALVRGGSERLRKVVEQLAKDCGGDWMTIRYA